MFDNSQFFVSGGFYSFPLEQSLRFNDDDSTYLSFTSASTLSTYTMSLWLKRGVITSSTYQYIFSYDNSGLAIGSTAGNTDKFYVYNGSTITPTDGVYRDPSAWYHLVLSVTSNTGVLYINGESVKTGIPCASIGTVANYFQIGRYQDNSGFYFDGYLAEVNFIDGTALDPTSFGETKENIWIPKDPSGLTYGTNGFRLSFADDAEVEAFNTVLWSGDDDVNRRITGVGFQSDLAWIKRRNGATNGSDHMFLDAVRGVGTFNALSSNGTQAEGFTAAGSAWANFGDIASFTTDGFVVKKGSDGSHTLEGINQSGGTYVAWCWDAGDSNVSNTDGSITSTVRANTTYGFSIVSYTGNGTSGATIGHGLSSAPSFHIIKQRNGTGSWVVYDSTNGATKHTTLNTTNASSAYSGLYNDTEPTSSVITLGNDVATNGNTNTYIAYCWAEKAGYSKFGSYEGNNTATGPTVTTTFKPALVIIKNADGTGNWNLFDNTRATFSDNDLILRANLSAAEVDGSGEGGDAYEVEFTNTGFIPKASGASSRSQVNGTGTYIYAAFADTRDAAFWLDSSGNNNDWQPENLDHSDTVADSPTDNFATWNGVVAGNFTLAEGNLKSTVNTNRNGIVSSMGFDPQDTDGYKAEFTINTLGNMVIGLADETFKTDEGTVFATTQARAVVYGVDGTVYDNGSSQGTFSSFTAGDVVTMYVKSGSLYYAVNGTLANSGSAVVTGITEDTVFWLHALSGASSGTLTANFGQQPFVYTTSLDS